MKKLILKILCSVGRHDWGKRCKQSGLYLHSFCGHEACRRAGIHRCWDCNKVEHGETNLRNK